MVDDQFVGSDPLRLDLVLNQWQNQQSDTRSLEKPLATNIRATTTTQIACIAQAQDYLWEEYSTTADHQELEKYVKTYEIATPLSQSDLLAMSQRQRKRRLEEEKMFEIWTNSLKNKVGDLYENNQHFLNLRVSSKDQMFGLPYLIKPWTGVRQLRIHTPVTEQVAGLLKLSEEVKNSIF